MHSYHKPIIFIPMKCYALAALLVVIVFSVFGQGAIRDYDFRKPPALNLENLDSVKTVKIYKAEKSGMGREPLDWNGYLENEITLNEAQQMISWKNYNDVASKVIEEYRFTYANEHDIYVEQVAGPTSKRHSWYLRDTLIHEIKLTKGQKGKQIAEWKYTYINDTLLSSLVKLDKMKEVEYQILHEYSEELKRTGTTVIVRGQPTSRLEANYDAEGKLTGYRTEDLKRNTESQRIEIERDSSAQVSAVDYLNKKGDSERWQNEYNEQGRKLRATRLNAEGEGLERMDFSYDARDNLTQRALYVNEVLKERCEWTYDAHDNIISEHIYRRILGNLGLVQYLIFTYDEGNRTIRKDYWSKQYNFRVRLDYEYSFF